MQKDCFDCDVPRLIMMPIMEIPDVLGWNGEDPYDVTAITVGGGLGKDCARRFFFGVCFFPVHRTGDQDCYQATRDVHQRRFMVGSS